MVDQLSPVTPADRDALEREIKRAEEAHARAFAQQQRMGRYNVSDSEARGIHQTVKDLERKAEDLRARRFAIAHGAVDGLVVASANRDELQKMIDARIQGTKHRIRVTRTDENGRILEFEKIPIPSR